MGRVSPWRVATSAALAAFAMWIVVLGPSQAAYADAGGYLAITNYQQNQSNWCWATAAEVAIKFLKGTVVSQCTLVHAEMGGSGCANVPATDGQELNLLLKYLGGASVSNGYLSYSSLSSNINLNRPVLAHIQWQGGGGHMVTMYWYENATNNGQASGTVVGYSNSDGAVGNGTNATTSSRTLSSFWNNSSFYQYSSFVGLHA